ncbi:MAG: site-2 protease family protein [Oscillospiraceae bacterium]|nr:site-2 protease family protein [Oscillospiraceae bacterium]
MLRLDPFTTIVRIIVLFTTIPVHEAAHAWVADRLGDPTGRYKGRLTLNPMAHFDLMGCIALVLTGIGWAKPVPVNPMNFDDRKKGMAITAAAGPVSNLILAAVSLIIAKIILYMGNLTGFGYVMGTLYTVFIVMCSTNISLAIFNLMPFPPFDGSRIFNYFLSDKYYFKIMQYEQYIFIGVFVLLWLGFFDGPLSFLNGIIYFVLNKLTFFVDIIFRIIL